MKITYKTDSNKCIDLFYDNVTYNLYPGETLDVNHEEQEDIMQIHTEKTVALNLFTAIFLLLKRIIVNILNVIIMNFSNEWLKESDPFILSAKYKADTQSVDLSYVPSRISTSPMFVERPQLLVNEKLIDSEVKLDADKLNNAFIKYCFDLFSLWLYGSLLITLIFVFSGKMSTLFILPILIIAAITIPLIVRIIKAYKEKIKLLEFLKHHEKTSDNRL